MYNIDFFDNKLSNNSIDSIITDPPYGIGYKEWDISIDTQFHTEWLTEAFRILKPGGTLWSFMAHCDKSGKLNIGDNFINILKKVGFDIDLRNTLIWARQKGRGASKHLKSTREDIYYAIKPGGKSTWNPLKMLREVIAPYMKDGRPRGWFLDENGKRVRWTGLGNVAVYSSPQWNHKTEKQLHPAQKPVMLMDRLIRLSSNEEDTILDPFMGSGTTGIACMLSNRKFIGFEKDINMFNIANNRLSGFKAEDYVGYSIKYKV